MKYQVLQIRITDAEADLINETGDFNAVPKFKARRDMDFPRLAGKKIRTRQRYFKPCCKDFKIIYNSSEKSYFYA